jgi:hypothetical protein
MDLQLSDLMIQEKTEEKRSSYNHRSIKKEIPGGDSDSEQIITACMKVWNG